VPVYGKFVAEQIAKLGRQSPFCENPIFFGRNRRPVWHVPTGKTILKQGENSYQLSAISVSALCLAFG
jgi:hypothetical protein